MTWIRRNLRGHLGWMLSLVLIGAGAKLWLIQRSASPLPFLDQWDGEAAAVYVPYLEHQLSLKDLFSPNNEHRIVFTRLYNLLLLILNRQWDNNLQATVNVFIHCAALAGFGWLMAVLLGRRWWPALWLLLAAALVPPFAWENTVWGFQSQFYFMLIAALLTIWWLGTAEVRSRRWWYGAVAGLLALLTMGSALLAAAAVIVLLAGELVTRRKTWRQAGGTAAVCVIIIALGWLMKVHVPRHDALKAHSVGAFFLALGKNLAWPSVTHPWLALVSMFPLAVLSWFWLSGKEESPPVEKMILGVGIWATLQAVAVAVERGGYGGPPDWRHMDLSSFLMIANGLAIVWLEIHHRKRLRFPVAWRAGFVVWAVTAGIGLWTVTDLAERYGLPSFEKAQCARLITTRAFMASDDEHVFEHHLLSELPFPYPPELIFLLRTPDIRTNLPACVRDPLKVSSAVTNSAFVPRGFLLTDAEPPTERSWGSYGKEGAAAQGSFESGPIQRSRLPYLEIPVAGDLGKPGLSLSLVELGSGRVTEIKPDQAAGGRWLDVQVKAPSGEFKMVARDDSPSGWFAFKEPREMGALSYWCGRMVATWKWFSIAGIVGMAWSLARWFSGAEYSQRQEQH